MGTAMVIGSTYRLIRAVARIRWPLGRVLSMGCWDKE
jgi:hypothetical protein